MLVKSVYVDYQNVEEVASFMHKTVEIDRDRRQIVVQSGSSDEKLLEVPIGRVCPENNVVITVGLYKASFFKNDLDPHVGISDDQGNINLFVIRDQGNYPNWPPCHVDKGDIDSVLVDKDTPVPGTFKFTTNPMKRSGVCETAQEGGYINTGKFDVSLDLSKPLYFRLNRHNYYELYRFYYFLIEVYKF